MGLVLGGEVGRRMPLQLGAEQLLGCHRILVDGDELGDAREICVVGKRIAILVRPASRDVATERERSGRRSRTEEGRAVAARDPAHEQAPVQQPRSHATADVAPAECDTRATYSARIRPSKPRRWRPDLHRDSTLVTELLVSRPYGGGGATPSVAPAVSSGAPSPDSCRSAPRPADAVFARCVSGCARLLPPEPPACPKMTHWLDVRDTLSRHARSRGYVRGSLPTPSTRPHTRVGPTLFFSHA